MNHELKITSTGAASTPEFTRIAKRVSLVSIFGNTLLSLLKLIAGLFAHSSAMVSDAVHSASDVFSSIVVIIGVKMSAKESDKDHPYGHERMECVAAIVLSIILFLTGLSIGVRAINTIISGEYSSLKTPGAFALVVAVFSIFSKELMFQYTKVYAKKIDSSALMADAWHHRSDALSSVGAFLGILGARIGFPIADPIASIVIFLFIVKASVDIFEDAMDKLVDHSCDEATENALRDCILSHPDVLGIDLIQTRIFGNKIYVDLEISLDASLSLKEAHNIAENVHSEIETTFPKVKHIMIHVNPKE